MFIEMKRVKRRYVLRARGEQVAETRARIVEAIMQLHGEVGPRHTTVSAIADRAGVERLTVYRHFPDEAAMFAACSHRYLELNPPPNPSIWTNERDPVKRTQQSLLDLYSFFGRTAPMFKNIYRDIEEYAALKTIMDQFNAHLRSMADNLAAAWPRDRKTAQRQTILRHATKFATWQSLEEDGINNQQKAELLLAWLSA